jgi:signal peptidase I
MASTATEPPASEDPPGQGQPAGATTATTTAGPEVEPSPGGGPVATQEAPGGPGGEPPAAPEKKGKDDRGPLSFLKELPVLLLVAFLLALLIKTFLVQAFYIPSESMQPTLQVGDRVLVNKVVYHLHPPRRGDIIVFSDPHPTQVIHRSAPSAFFHWLTEGLGVQTDPTKDFIKRVVGLPGETVEFNHCTVFINGKALTEPYAHVRDCRQYGPVKVPSDSLFVMGDNRPNSNDSRYGLGFVPYDKVIGRAFVIIWPPSHVGWLHGL